MKKQKRSRIWARKLKRQYDEHRKMVMEMYVNHKWKNPADYYLHPTKVDNR